MTILDEIVARTRERISEQSIDVEDVRFLPDIGSSTKPSAEADTKPAPTAAPSALGIPVEGGAQ